jgi:hypothetical protein
VGQLVVAGANLQCTFGAAPSALNVLPMNRVMGAGPAAANIMDNKPMLNIPPFGMCMSMANPQVAAATAAAMGVLTPMPCLPVIPAPWMPGSPTVQIANMPALNNSSKCLCAWGGQISVLVPGQFTVQVP